MASKRAEGKLGDLLASGDVELRQAWPEALAREQEVEGQATKSLESARVTRMRLSPSRARASVVPGSEAWWRIAPVFPSRPCDFKKVPMPTFVKVEEFNVLTTPSPILAKRRKGHQ